jgi:hypothetical protein
VVRGNADRRHGCRPAEAVFLKLLQQVTDTEPGFRRLRRLLLLWSAGLLAAEVAMAIVLPVLYSRAQVYLAQFSLIEEYVVAVSKALWYADVARATATHALTGAVGLGVPLWYEMFGDPLPVIRALASQLEGLHRCVIYGCDARGVPGVALDARLSDYFLGSGGVDRALKDFIASLRNARFDELFTAYTEPAHVLLRALPWLYEDNFTAWTGSYLTALGVGVAVVFAGVVAVAVTYYRLVVARFGRDVARYRFILKLLPAEAVGEVPLAGVFLANTAWADEADAAADERAAAASAWADEEADV